MSDITDKSGRPKIVQILIGPEDPKWQGRMIGLDSEGRVHSVAPNGRWELAVECAIEIGETKDQAMSNDETDNQLKPCPFCGTKPERRVSNDILQVRCLKCVVGFYNHVRFGCRADAQWNTRTEDKQ